MPRYKPQLAQLTPRQAGPIHLVAAGPSLRSFSLSFLPKRLRSPDRLRVSWRPGRKAPGGFRRPLPLLLSPHTRGVTRAPSTRVVWSRVVGLAQREEGGCCARGKNDAMNTANKNCGGILLHLAENEDLRLASPEDRWFQESTRVLVASPLRRRSDARATPSALSLLVPFQDASIDFRNRSWAPVRSVSGLASRLAARGSPPDRRTPHFGGI